MFSQEIFTADILFYRSLFDESPFTLQYVAFEPTVKKLGTEEQKAKWLPLIQSFQVIGTYAQTELGHGRSGEKYNVFHVF